MCVLALQDYIRQSTNMWQDAKVLQDIETTKGFDPLKGLAVIAYFER